MHEAIRLFFVGIILGVANIIPGVSGGTLAVVFNIYDRIIGLISLNIKKIISEWKFLLPLALGMGAGIIGFSKILTFLFENYPMQTNLFFVGIIAGSIPLVYRKIKSSMQEISEKNKKPYLSTIICFIVALAIMIVMTVFKDFSGSSVIYTELSGSLFLLLLVSGALGAVAMIIPGISGSFLLLAIGTYATVIGSVSDFNIPLMIPTAIGILLGLFFGAFLVRTLMKKVPTQTYGSILGLVIGSIFTVFPLGMIITRCSQLSGNTFTTSLGALFVGLVCCAVGFLTSYFSSKNS
jgi:putative membrane protein